ncbi:ComEA family DNA-binding protein [Tuwongella immobilis]|uniref:Helix-hairpin-helix DNA-binding motif class 1 domain-containing protein n=1 Tax=Tuwongella immobilis TaxID=692036 RepID=A0A6C2YH58_9BACT|nr:helix-hairpin-helix domain-containing protein [Tuwongella immobilis]VIP00860.1 competence protein helix-hairpin-helix repeat region : Late competence protein ComEA OS=Bacillus wakoensis JCM 9140 GN=JCM9140_3196 PE=4 SV=1: HHH_3 [Tuwongella immobilis]VTR97138.1 competence protein helix-hairpin-helix repeat region : Late competence protein ComEA OS=Bacillus wakoensis JCM 9140 GN=JCM9140_3196 PE=4 SV=1: HHH_3 [Tuwongella immobilis]
MAEQEEPTTSSRVPVGILLLLLVPTILLIGRSIPWPRPAPVVTPVSLVQRANPLADDPLQESPLESDASGTSPAESGTFAVERLARKPVADGPEWQAGYAPTQKITPDDGPIDINRADLATLQRLPGIGPVLASRIIASREERPFEQLMDLRRVSGIGPKRIEQLRPLIVFTP